MDDKHRDLLRTHRVYLLENLQPKSMIDHLVEKKLLSDDELDEIRAEKKTKEQIRLIIDKLPRKGPTAFDKFIEVLKVTGQEYVATKLCGDLVKQDVVEPSPLFPIPFQETRREDVSSKANVPVLNLPSKTETDAHRDDCYPMTKVPRGMALIINNKHFHPKCGMNMRKGTDVDAANLQQAFKFLGFLATVLHDQGTNDMEDNLRKLARYDHSNYDCVVVCILTHGVEGKLYGSDGNLIEVQRLIRLFNGDQAPYLVGKPKLFFIQACRGDSFDYGRDESDGHQNDTDGVPAQEPVIIERALGEGVDETDAKMSALPVEADMLLAYATVPGYVSWRNSERGSWFVQALTEVLVHDATKDDVTHMMVSVNRKVATEFEAKGRRKQMPAPVVQLLKKLYFR